MKRKLISVAIILTVFISLLAGCGSKNVINPEADDPNITDEQWATDVFYTAVDKLLDSGEIGKSSIDSKELFLYEAGKMKFKTAELEKKYTKDDFSVSENEGKIIWAFVKTDSSSEEERRPVDTLNKDDNDEKKRPEYYSQGAETRVSEDNFAVSRGECGYLMVYGSFVARVDGKFYRGGIDRKITATEVFVIDALKKEVVHIEHIGTSTPPTVTTNPRGSIRVENALNYMAGITK